MNTKFVYIANREPATLVLKIRANGKKKVAIHARDPVKPHTYYTRRWNTVNGGVEKFLIRLPQSPEKLQVMVGEAQGEHGIAPSPMVRLEKRKCEPIKQRLEAFDSSDPKVWDCIRFIQEFAEDAAIISAMTQYGRSIYTSDDGMFCIHYVDTIRSSNTGNEINTPARTLRKNGRIEVSKKKFLEYTVPMRVAILLHEIAHFYMNEDMEDEKQADLNALKIYLGLGYPRIDAEKAFLKVFQGAPTDQNKERHEMLKWFIRNFDDIRL